MMRIFRPLTFLFIFSSFLHLFSEDIDISINYSAVRTENKDRDCVPIDESYKWNVFKARKLILNGKSDKAAEYYLRHLVCWNDSDIYAELGKFYESQGKYYLAGIAYKKSGKVDELKRLEQLSAQQGNSEDYMFRSLSNQKATNYSKSFKAKKTWATALNIIGPVAFATGLSLFIHDKAGGENSLSAQYVLMLGGLTMVGGGTILNAHAEKDRRLSKAYNFITDQYPGFYGTDPDEYFVHSGISGRLYKNYSDKYFAQGLALIFIALPIIGFGIYSYFDTIEYINENDDSEYPELFDLRPIGRALFYVFVQSAVFVPAVCFIFFGSKMMADSSKWKKMNTEPDILTLTSITPIINPVSKTYGLALGFSF